MLRGIFVFRIPQPPEIPEPEFVRSYLWFENPLLMTHVPMPSWTRGIAYDPETDSFILASEGRARVYFINTSLLTSSEP